MRPRWTVALLCPALLFFYVVGTPAVQAAEPPTVSARSAVVYAPQRDMLLYDKAGDVKRPVASTTKLMTALLAAERLSTENTVQVPPGAVPVEGTQVGLKVGDTLTVRDLLAGLLLVSGNDAANTLALLMAPTTADFAALMNERAQQLGMTNSLFVTPSGLDQADNGATARDMAVLAAAVLEVPVLAELCGMQTATITVEGRRMTLRNHNKLLGLVDGCVGLKTGFTRKAGRCLVSAVRRDGITLIAVTLYAPDDWNDHVALYDYAFSRVRQEPLPSVVPDTCPVMGGTLSAVPLTAPVPDMCVLLREETLTAQVYLPPFVWADVEQGQTVGEVRYTAGERTVHTAPIRAAQTVPVQQPPPFWTLVWRRFLQLISGLCT